jgi:hypothetical protein
VRGADNRKDARRQDAEADEFDGRAIIREFFADPRNVEFPPFTVR